MLTCSWLPAHAPKPGRISLPWSGQSPFASVPPRRTRCRCLPSRPAASDQLSGRSLPGITLSEGEPGASDPSGIGDGVRWRPPMGPALRWPVGQAFEPPETPAVRRSHARHRCRSPDRMGGHRPKKLVCATGVAAAAVPGQGVHLARPSRRAGRAWPQRRLSCGLAVRS